MRYRGRSGALAIAVGAVALIAVSSCLGDKGGNGRKGLDHELDLSAIAPDNGPKQGGTDVLIIGFNFKQDGPITDVLFGATPAVSFEVESNNQIDAVTPAHLLGLVDVTVRNADGDEATLFGAFEFVGPPPTCVSVLPDTGEEAGGDLVTISTIGFLDDFTVNVPLIFFDADPVSPVIPLNNTTVQIMTPPSPAPAPHTIDVTVEGTGLPESCTFVGGFTYELPGPQLCMSLNPDSGPQSGGNTVLITSLGPCLWDPSFPGTLVLFGGVPSTNVVVVNDTLISCIAPASLNPGPVDVEVISSTCSCLLPDGYTYISPACMTVTPDRGDAAGGAAVTLANLAPCSWDPSGVGVFFDGVSATNIFVNGPGDLITCNTPPGARLGPVDVEVISTGCDCLLPNGFTYTGAGCGLGGITPNTGGTNGGVSAIIFGSNFDVSGVEILFDSVYATNVVVISSTQVSCDVPPSCAGGLVDLTVRSIADPTNTCTLPDAFTYILPGMAACSIQSVVPDTGPQGGGTTVTISGTGFGAGTGVLFGNRPAAQIVAISPTLLEVVTPVSDQPGVVDVCVAPQGSDPCVDQNGFTYQ